MLTKAIKFSFMAGLFCLVLMGSTTNEASGMCGDNISATFCTEHCSKYTVTSDGVYRKRYAGHSGGTRTRGKQAKNIYYTKSASRAREIINNHRDCQWDDQGRRATVTCIFGSRTEVYKIRKTPRVGDTPFDLKFRGTSCDGANARRGHYGDKIVKLNPDGDRNEEYDPRADRYRP